MTASVPEDTNRIRSIDGMAARIRSPSSTSRGDVAPRANPSRAASRTASTTAGTAWPRIAGPQDADVVEVPAAVDVPDARAPAGVEDERRPPDGAERPDRAVDAAREQVLGVLAQRRLAAAGRRTGPPWRAPDLGQSCQASRAQVARSAAAYVITKPAPARRIAVVDSVRARRRSSQPRCAAASIDANSPLTWYAPIGTSNRGAGRGQDVQRRQRRLDQQHVRALGHVDRHLAHRLAGVGRVHLVAAPVTERGRGARGVPERAVERRGGLRGVGEDRRRPAKPPASRPRRIAATWPSIIPLGATMSAPASAWEAAVRA